MSLGGGPGFNSRPGPDLIFIFDGRTKLQYLECKGCASSGRRSPITINCTIYFFDSKRVAVDGTQPASRAMLCIVIVMCI